MSDEPKSYELNRQALKAVGTLFVPRNLQRVSPLQAALLEASGGLVLGGKRDAEGNLIVDEEKPRLRG